MIRGLFEQSPTDSISPPPPPSDSTTGFLDGGADWSTVARDLAFPGNQSNRITQEQDGGSQAVDPVTALGGMSPGQLKLKVEIVKIGLKDAKSLNSPCIIASWRGLLTAIDCSRAPRFVWKDYRRAGPNCIGNVD